MYTTNIYYIFEQEFGRQLSPMEKEFITEWKNKSISEETIILALRQSIFNGVRSFRYMDKILDTWSKEDNNPKPKNETVELDDDWLN